MPLPTNFLSCLALFVVCAIHIASAQAQLQPPTAPTIAGAISDLPQLDLTLGPNEVIRVLEGPQNQLFDRSAADWSRKTYHYLPTMVPARQGDGTYARVQRIGSRTLLFVFLRAKPVDVDQVYRELSKARPAVARQSIIPISPHEITVQVGDIQLGIVSAAAISSLFNPNTQLQFSAQVDSEEGKDIAGALNAGQFAPVVTAFVVQKLSARNQFDAEAKRAMEAKMIQEYFGPSGPQYITAAQELDVKVSIDERYSERVWQEAEDSTRSALFSFVLDKLRKPTPEELSLEGGKWTSGMKIEVADLLKFTDEVHSVASDAKNLSSSEFCSKYKSLWENNESLERQRSGSAKIPIKKIVFGISGKSDKKKVANQRREIANSDCGKEFVESQFKYNQTGKQFIPKSILVYQTLKGTSNLSVELSSQVFKVSQRYAPFVLQFSQR